MTRQVALAALALVVGAALGGCRDVAVATGPDLASPIFFCPSVPPPARTYACEPSAIPYCTFPSAQVTCYCVDDGAGGHVLDCAVDAGATTD